MKDAVPVSWKNGLVQATMGAGRWIDDLVKRVVHLDELAKAGPRTGSDASPYWLGGLFNPDAFVTATRQHVAQALSCSLEELRLSLVVGSKADDGESDWSGRMYCGTSLSPVEKGRVAQSFHFSYRLRQGLGRLHFLR